MKSLLIPALAGALCLPATYRLSRDGDFPVALLAIVVIGTAGAAIAMAMSEAKGQRGLISLGLAFVLGAFLSEIVGFVWYYLDYGYKDQYLSVGVVLSIAEFGAISLFGGAATCVVTLALRRGRTRPDVSGG